jgi:hypothetical protein
LKEKERFYVNYTNMNKEREREREREEREREKVFFDYQKCQQLIVHLSKIH